LGNSQNEFKMAQNIPTNYLGLAVEMRIWGDIIKGIDGALNGRQASASEHNTAKLPA
jgi:hypothetical protein